MKLISMHITAFGKFADLDHDFTDGINSFCEDNGYGKSTMVAFIKAMFYGLPAYKTNSVFNDRAHFYPFAKGTFGGSIDFESDGKRYRIERTFSAKSTTSDTMKVYLGADLTDELGDVPGVKVFGLNKESFERMLCMDQQAIRLSSTDDMNKKLNNYVENVGEDFDIESVKKTISAKEKQCRDKASSLKKEIVGVRESIKKLEYEKKALDEKYTDLNNAQKLYKQAENAYSQAAQLSAEIEKWNNLDDKSAQCNETEQQLKQLVQSYKNGLPDKQKTEDVKGIIEQIKRDELALKACACPDEDIALHTRIKRQYETFPTQQQIDDAGEQIGLLEKKKTKCAELESAQQGAAFSELADHFSGKPVSSETIFEIEQKKKRYDELASVLSQTNRKVYIHNDPVKVEQKPKSKLYAVLLIIALLLVVCGAGVLVAGKTAVGIILLAAGAVLLFADAFLYILGKVNSVQAPPQQEPQELDNPEYTELAAKTQAARNELVNSIAYYRYSPCEPDEMFYTFKNDAQRFNELLAKNNKAEREYSETKASCGELEAKLSSFFNPFGLNDADHKKNLETLKSDMVRFVTLDKSIKDSKSKQVALLKGIEDAKEQIVAFQSQYSLDDSFSPDQILDDIKEYERLSELLKKQKLSAESYRSSNNLLKRPVQTAVDLETLRDDASKKQAEFNALSSEVERMEDSVSQLDDKKNTYDLKNEEIEDVKERLTLLSDVKKEILSADQSLKDRYIAPVRDKFCYYAQLIENALGQKVVMDKDFSIKFERQGEYRSYEHLSGGNLAVCALCFRLALLDNMFTKNQPMLIMDDPFTALDSEHITKTSQLLRELSKNRQILYFCCHESRKLI